MTFQIYPTESASAGYLASTSTAAAQLSSGNIILMLIVITLIICLQLLVNRLLNMLVFSIY